MIIAKIQVKVAGGVYSGEMSVPMLLLPPKAKARQVRMSAEAVMQTQKLTWGDVQGENMMNHNKAAISRLITSLLLSRIFMVLLDVMSFYVRASMISPMASVMLKASCSLAVASSRVAIALMPSDLQDSICLQLPRAMGKVMKVTSVHRLT